MYEHQVRNTWQFIFVDVKKKKEKRIYIKKNMQSKFRLIKMIKQYYTKMYHYILLLRIHTLSLSFFLPLPFFLSLFLLTTAGKYFPVYYQILYRFNSDKVIKSRLLRF